jgi:hypothetical protein
VVVVLRTLFWPIGIPRVHRNMEVAIWATEPNGRGLGAQSDGDGDAYLELVGGDGDEADSGAPSCSHKILRGQRFSILAGRLKSKPAHARSAGSPKLVHVGPPGVRRCVRLGEGHLHPSLATLLLAVL